MEKSFLWACQTDHSEQGRVSIRAAMRPNNVAVCNITSFFFKEEIMTIRTIGDFKKKLVMQLELEFLKVVTSNYDGGVTFYKNSGASTRRIRQPTRAFLKST